MTWMLSGFEKGGNALVRKVDVDEVLRAIFRALLHQPDSEPMRDSFPVDAAALARINEMLELDLDPADADYFLDYWLEFQPRTTE